MLKNIIYCEDNLDHIKLFIKDFCSKGSVLYGYRVTPCRTPEELLKLAKDRPEIVLMDIDLNNGKTGIDMAEELYSVSRSTQIIYVSAYTDKFIQDVFLRQANVCGFLNKPIEKQYLKKMIDRAEQRAAENSSVTVSFKGERFTLYENDILYIESYKRRLFFHTAAKTYEIYGTLSDYAERMNNFAVTHQSFAVNKRYIKGMKLNQLLLTDGTVIPVSRTRLKEIKELLMNEASAEANGKDQ